MQPKKGWDAYLMASVFEKEAAYDGGKTHTNVTSSSYKGFDFDPGYGDTITSDKDEITGKEHGYDQEITAYANMPTLKFARVRPNDLAGFAALVLGSFTSYQDPGKTAYRHRLLPIADGSDLPSISIVHKIGGIQTEFKGVKGNTMTLSGEAGGFLSADFGLIASGTRATNAATIAASITESWMKVDQVKFWLETGANILIPHGTCTITIAAPGVITYVGHGMAASQGVIFTTTGALPTGLTAGTVYYVKIPIADSFSVSATPGGENITTSGSQSGVHTLEAVPLQHLENISSATPDNLSIRGKSFEFGWDNKLEGQPGMGGAGVFQDAVYGRRAATFKSSIIFASSAEIAYFTGQETCAIEIDLKSAALIAAGGTMYYGASIIIPRAKIKAYPAPKGGVNDSLTQDFDFEIFDDGTNNAIIMDVYTAQAAYLATPA